MFACCARVCVLWLWYYEALFAFGRTSSINFDILSYPKNHRFFFCIWGIENEKSASFCLCLMSRCRTLSFLHLTFSFSMRISTTTTNNIHTHTQNFSSKKRIHYNIFDWIKPQYDMKKNRISVLGYVMKKMKRKVNRIVYEKAMLSIP